MKKIIIAVIMTISSSLAFAQYSGPGARASNPGGGYTGPGAEATVMNVKQLQDSGRDDQRVVLRGHLIKAMGDEKYLFADGTGEIPVEIDHKRWPVGLTVNEKTTVELTGEYDKEIVGTSKVEVRFIQVVQ